MRNWACVALVFAGPVIAGCAASSDQQSQPIVSEVEGVLHVELPSRIPGEVPQWRLREIYNTSESESGIELFRVRAARLLGDGSLVIANSGTHEILQIDAKGALHHRFGRAGSGPGEFGAIASLDVDHSGNLLVYDPREIRLTRIAPSGNVLETRRLSSENAVVDLQPLAELADGRIMAVFGAMRVFGKSGEGRDTVPLIVVNPSAASWDTIGTWPAQEWAFLEFSQGVTRTQVGFGRSLAYAGRGGRAALASTDSLDLSVFDTTGSIAMRIMGWGSNVEVSTANVEQWRNELVEKGSRAPEEIRRWFLSAPYRNTYPAFRDLLLDDTGRVWIGMFPEADQPQSWLVIGADGHLEGQVTVPGESTLLDAAGERVAILRRNSLDEEYIVVMEIEHDR